MLFSHIASVYLHAVLVLLYIMSPLCVRTLWQSHSCLSYYASLFFNFVLCLPPIINNLINYTNEVQATLKYTGSFDVSLIFVANEAFCTETSSHEIHQAQLGQQLFSQERNLKKKKKRGIVLEQCPCFKKSLSLTLQLLTSPCQIGLTVLHMILDLFSCPWWGRAGKMLCFPGWMEIFR